MSPLRKVQQFVSYSIISTEVRFVAMMFTADFKLGHYMKIPPRVIFFGQVVATAVAGTVQLGVQSWCVCYSFVTCFRLVDASV
jgi:hypothetical protein